MIWLRWSVGIRAIALPHSLYERHRADVDRIRHPVPHRHVERRYRPVVLDDDLRAGGVTSVNHGDAASWRRKVVYAWMSTVRPSIETRTSGAPVESVDTTTCGCPGCAPAMITPIGWMRVIQV